MRLLHGYVAYARPMPTPAVELEVGDRTVRVTSPDKVYFPEVGLTKLDVVSYVVASATASSPRCRTGR